MAQLIIVIIASIFVKLLLDVVQDQVKKYSSTHEAPKGGQVIDLSNAWIDLDNMPYHGREYLLAGRELDMYRLLQEVLPLKDYAILPRVRLADVIEVSPAANNRVEYDNRIKERSIELLICTQPSLKPVLAVIFEIESEGKKKQLAYRFMRKALEAANFPYLDIKPGSLPTSRDLTVELRRQGLNL